MNLRDFIKRHRDDLNRFAADWDKAISEEKIAPPTTHDRWFLSFRYWLKADAERFSDHAPTTPRGTKR